MADNHDYFDTASKERGTGYLEARDELLLLAANEQQEILGKLQTIIADSGDWERQLTAEIIAGWLRDRETFTVCTRLVRGEVDAPKPMGGFTSAWRASAVAALGVAVTPRVLEMLIKTHEYRDETELKALFGALVELEDSRAVMPMVALLSEQSSDEIRLEAVNVLAMLHDPRGLEPLLELAKNPNANEEVRSTAIRSLGSFEDQKVAQALSEIMTSAVSLEDRRAAADAIRERADPSMRALVAQVLATTEDEAMQLTLINTLEQIGDAEDIPLLQQLSERGTKEVKAYANYAIQAITQRTGKPH